MGHPSFYHHDLNIIDRSEGKKAKILTAEAADGFSVLSQSLSSSNTPQILPPFYVRMWQLGTQRKVIDRARYRISLFLPLPKEVLRKS